MLKNAILSYVFIFGFGIIESANLYDVRLLHGKEPHKGLVQVRSDEDEWSFVHDNHWSRNNSHVVCQQLGYSFASVQAEGDWSGFPEASDPFLQLQFKCIGTEEALSECEIVETHGEETQRQIVAIECQNAG